MYVILVYDVNEERVSKVCQYLRRYLNWVQNSVFEGELSGAELLKVKAGLSELIEEGDSVRIYIFRDKKYVIKETLGKEKSDTSQII